MPVTNDKFDQLKIDKLKHFLEDMAGKGQPRPYEIFVDNLKVIPKTEDPKDFDQYEYYMNEDTEKIRILIYNSASTPRNDQYCFYVQQHKAEKSSGTLGEIDNIIQDKLNARDKEHEYTRTKTELEETQVRLEEAEQYIEDLENRLEIATNDKYKVKNLNLVELGVAVLGRFAEKHSDMFSQFGLSGITSSTSKELPANGPVEGQASFQKKVEAQPQQPPEVSPELLQYLTTLQEMDAVFSKDELVIVMHIIGKFCDDKTNLKKVSDFLNIQIP